MTERTWEQEERFFNEVAERLGGLAVPGARAEQTGGGIFCVFVPLPMNRLALFGTADVKWGGSVVDKDTEEFTGDEIPTDVDSETDDAEAVAKAIAAAVGKYAAEILRADVLVGSREQDREFAERLGRARSALFDALMAWPDEDAHLIRRYPLRIPSFDEFVHEFAAWVEDVGELTGVDVLKKGGA